jgi:hypothetical protein
MKGRAVGPVKHGRRLRREIRFTPERERAAGAPKGAFPRSRQRRASTLGGKCPPFGEAELGPFGISDVDFEIFTPN